MPLSLDTILNELPPDDEMWVLQDRVSGKYLTIPDQRYPGRRPIRFFMSRENAEAILQELLAVNIGLSDKEIITTKVRLLPAILGIAANRNPNNADSFVIHTPNEVFAFVWERS